MRHQLKDGGKNTGVLLFLVTIRLYDKGGKRRRMGKVINYTKVYSGDLNGRQLLGRTSLKEQDNRQINLKETFYVLLTVHLDTSV